MQTAQTNGLPRFPRHHKTISILVTFFNADETGLYRGTLLDDTTVVGLRETAENNLPKEHVTLLQV